MPSRDGHMNGSAPTPRWPLVLRWTALAAVVLGAILIPFVVFEGPILDWTQTALVAARQSPALGVALVVGLLAGDVVLPVPSSLVSVFAGAAFGWFAGAMVIWIGMTLGCVAGYALGVSAGRLLALRVVGEAELERAKRLFESVGPVALIVTRAVPVLAEAGTLAAGAARMPLLSFLVSTSLANAAVAAAYAAVGAAAASSQSFLILFLGLALVPALAWSAWLRVRRSHASESKD
jgi:uncharacterized membrane protein YdjX (TVP38/TMEM64 family)